MNSLVARFGALLLPAVCALTVLLPGCTSEENPSAVGTAESGYTRYLELDGVATVTSADVDTGIEVGPFAVLPVVGRGPMPTVYFFDRVGRDVHIRVTSLDGQAPWALFEFGGRAFSRVTSVSTATTVDIVVRGLPAERWDDPAVPATHAYGVLFGALDNTKGHFKVRISRGVVPAADCAPAGPWRAALGACPVSTTSAVAAPRQMTRSAGPSPSDQATIAVASVNAPGCRFASEGDRLKVDCVGPLGPGYFERGVFHPSESDTVSGYVESDGTFNVYKSTNYSGVRRAIHFVGSLVDPAERITGFSGSYEDVLRDKHEGMMLCPKSGCAY